MLLGRRLMELIINVLALARQINIKRFELGWCLQCNDCMAIAFDLLILLIELIKMLTNLYRFPIVSFESILILSDKLFGKIIFKILWPLSDLSHDGLVCLLIEGTIILLAWCVSIYQFKLTSLFVN
jgi:hypothetical protein